LAVLRHHQGDHLLLGKVLKCCNFHVEYYRPAGEKSASDFSGRERLLILRNMSIQEDNEHFKTLIHERTAGLEIQTLEADLTREGYAGQLWKDSINTACSAPAGDGPALHPAEAGKPAAFIYRLPSPYVAVETACEALLYKDDPGDTCTLSFSTDGGKTWNVCFEKQSVGKEDVTVDIGNKPYFDKKPSVTSNYVFWVKAEFEAKKNPGRTGLGRLKITAKRQLNKRCLMNLMPGENVLRISADKLTPGMALVLEVNYILNDKPVTAAKTIDAFPFYFRINLEGLSENYLKTPIKKSAPYNIPSWPLRMASIGMRLVDAKAAKPDTSLSAAEAEPFFKKKCPYPFDPFKSHAGKARSAGDGMAIGGFFPQKPKPESRALSNEEKARMNELVGKIARWENAEALGAYPEAVDALIKELPRANEDLTIYICKALAQIGDRKAVPVLLDKWNKQLSLAPGSRYIPDALAACGDPSVVPDLIRPLKTLRPDYRFHVIHALGILGGSQAKETLEFLAENDPFYANRVLARGFLSK
ncbi:MAG: HEAT repeat domain-containing protein, partial [Planctomycetota bacterium]